MTDQRVAIVGAGVAGAGVASALKETPVSVTVFERTDRIGGRAATHHTGDCTYDPGANYVKSDSSAVSELLTETLDTEGLIDITEPVWTFTEEGTIAPGDESDTHKWSYRNGVAQLPQRLFDRSTARVITNTSVNRVSHDDQEWTLTSETGTLGTFDSVVLTPPAPRTAALLASTQRGYNELRATIEQIEYRSIYTVLLGYPFELDVPYYALVNTDRTHDIGWLSREECKPGHVPEGESLLVVQMAPDWSARKMDDTGDESEIVREVIARTTTLLDDPRLHDPAWTDTAVWAHALPERGTNPHIDPETRRRAERDGLYLAGDWLAGEGRVHRALESGLETGRRLTDR